MCRVTQIGVVSYGNECPSHGVYARVTEVKNWIQYITKEASLDSNCKSEIPYKPGTFCLMFTLRIKSDLILSAIIVTGGEASEVSVEVIREDGTLCSMADWPPRVRHSMSGFTVCGGSTKTYGDTISSCSTLTAGEWETTHNMNVLRSDHLSWNSPNGTLLLGGCWNCDPSYQTTEFLSTISSSSAPAFTLLFDT